MAKTEKGHGNEV